MILLSVRAGCLLVCSLLAGAPSAFGQGPGRLPLSRADDNFLALSHDSTHKTTPTPGIKALPLNRSGSVYVGFGGEIRQQVQVFANENFGEPIPGEIQTNDGTPFLLQRYVLNANLQLGKYIRVFGELKSAFENGRNTGPRPVIDVDKLDVHQLFADINLTLDAKTKMILRVGRQELNYGASRFVALNEGPNVRLSFQGAKLMINHPAYFIHLFYTNPVSNRPGVFDDVREKSVTLLGAYTNWKTPHWAGSALDVYALNYRNEEAVYVAGEGKENRYMAGLRWYRLPGEPFQFDVEATYQVGRLGEENIRAYYAVAIASYEFDHAPWKPKLQFIANVISGDRGRASTLGTFNPLFPRVFLGLGIPFFPTNLINMTPTVEVHPVPKLAVIGAVHGLWRYSIHDGLYTEGRIIREPFQSGTSTLSTASFIGMQYDLTVEYDITNYLALALYGTVFPAGAYLRESGAGRTIGWTLFQAKFRF